MLNEKLFFQHLEMFFQPYKTIFANCQLTNIKSSSKEYKKFDQKNFKVRPKNLKVRHKLKVRTTKKISSARRIKYKHMKNVQTQASSASKGINHDLPYENSH
jgi:hypothetical protein